MPWMETVPVDQRVAFIADHRRDLYPVAELCARYGISRKTGYKWLERFDAEGRRGLVDRSRPRTIVRITVLLAKLDERDYIIRG